VDSTPIRIVLELNPDTGPLQAGCVHQATQSSPFSGWMGLADALSAIRTAAPRTEDVPSRASSTCNPFTRQSAAIPGDDPTRQKVQR
jgi:hypothetical protein